MRGIAEYDRRLHNPGMDLKDPIDRSRKFISYGLGQEKLTISHYNEYLSTLTDSDEKEEIQKIVES
jgi:hypothetical protein